MKNNIIYLISAVVMTVFISCSSNDEPNTGTSIQPNLSIEEKSMVEQQNKFAIKFFESIYRGQNIIVSPLSAACNFSLLANASVGNTQEEFLSALECEDIATLNSMNYKLMGNIGNLDPKKVKVSLANSIWMNSLQDVDATKDFKTIANKNYKAKITSMPLDKDAFKTINAWASKETNGLINDFYQSEDVNGQEIIFMNALYFKGEFTEKFDKTKTVSMPFYTLTGNTKTVDMMKDLRKLPYMNNEKTQAISLSFGNGAFEMIVALPNNGASLSDAAWEALTLNSDVKKSVNVSMPKFKEETSINFKNVYQNFGIDVSKANLSNITVKSEPLSGGVIATKQRTIFSVDENGAEGASVTGTAVDGFMPSEIHFTADHPFVYMIREKTSGAILFMGAYVN